ncbi:MAG: 3-hydroxyacyl-CoA dehydrogenase NAD-binding domain-containing protein [Gammaproteobacteria bacterium]
MKSYLHWKIAVDDMGLVWLTIDRQDSSANSLNEPVLREFADIIEHFEKERPRALIIRSGKSSGFIAGADIEQFKTLESADEATVLIRKGQLIFDSLEKLPFPTLAMIDGFCLGGGMELALACRYRIAVDSPKTRLGLPEVKLGIHPGWGGTVRLPKLLGALKAMDLNLSGRLLRAKQAKRMGLVDAAVPLRLAEIAAREMALNPPPRKQSMVSKITNLTLIRPWLAKLFYRQLNKKVKKTQYPSPFKIVENWVKEGTDDQAYIREAESIGQLLVSKTSRNLVRIFFLQEKLKSLGKSAAFKPKHIHVIGAGTMGGDIAAWCAVKGYMVTLQDQKPEFIAPAIGRAYRLAEKQLKEPHEITKAMDRLMPDVAGIGVRHADVIIEAVTEKLEVKQAVFKHLEKMAKADAILATNTSTIPLEEISTCLQHPERLIGIHFFNPVAKMPLVEVIHADKTSKAWIDKGLAFVKQIDKLPLPVKSSPGFLVNRILLPYMLEAVALLEEGVPGPTIDKAAVEFGMPVGPIELADIVGLDICLAALEKLAPHLGAQIPEQLRQLVSQNRLGKKTNHGFYEYQNDKVVKPKVTSQHGIPKDIIDRLSLRMLNEAIACLREGIVESADLLDAGTIFGFGFPPFRGGAIHFTQEEGLDRLKQQLEKLETRYGNRFAADKGWDSVVAA